MMPPTTDSLSHSVPEKPMRLAGEHWYELTATLPAIAAQDFADWLDAELSALESSLDQFSSPRARGESPRR